MIIDIIDNFSLFTQQAKKRLKYYTSMNYKILGKEEESTKIELNGTCLIKDE
jgi:hypothetical protein